MTQPPRRDPRQPFGSPASPSSAPHTATGSPVPPREARTTRPVHASQFAPAPRRRRWWIPVVGLLLLALLALAARHLAADPAPLPTESASAAPDSPVPTTPVPSAPAARTSVPFENPAENVSGTFEITQHAWTQQGLVLTVRVHVDQGQQRLGFFALDNALATDYQPGAPGPDGLEGRVITAGQTLSGTVTFDKPHGATTVFLTGTNGKQVAALVVPA